MYRYKRVTDLSRLGRNYVRGIDDIVAKIEKYNKNKFKKNHIKLPKNIETNLFVMIAENMDNNEQTKSWYIKAYKNCINCKETQAEIGLKLKELGYDIDSKEDTK